MSLPIMDMSLDSACGEHSRALTMQRLNTDGRLSGAMIRMVVDFVLVVLSGFVDCMNCIIDYRQGAVIGRIFKEGK